MRVLTRRLRANPEGGFTLIELLIVILVLSILAGIAIFASQPFADRAELACGDANAKIDRVADAAIDAGVSVDKADLYSDQPGDCVGGGSGSGGGSTAFTATLEQSWAATTQGNPTAVVLNATPDPNNLLVAVTAHRQNVDNTNPGTPAMAGWTPQGTASFMSSSGDRRAVAVFTKIATGADTASVTWTGTGITTVSLLVREYSRGSGSWAHTANFQATNGVSAPASPFNLTGVDGFSGSGLVVAGVVLRDGPATVTFSGVGSGQHQLLNGIGTHVGFASVSGTGPHPASVTFSGGSPAAGGISGFVLAVR